MYRSAATLVLALAACGVASEAMSQSFEIKALDIEKGGIDIELNNAVFSGRAGNSGNRSGHEQVFSYGVTNWWRLAAAVDWDNPVGDDLRATNLGIENIFLLRPMKQKQDIGLGLFVALEPAIHNESTNAFVFGPIVTVKWDKLLWTFNPFLEQTFGRNREEGIALTYGWQAKYEVREGLSVGV